MTAPVDELTEPKASDPIPDLVENVLGLPQYLSPSYWLGWAAEQVCGTNPWQWLAEEYTGDWEAVAKAGEAVRMLAGFNDAFAGTINSAVATVGYDWQGNASDSADEYFSEIVQNLRGQIGFLESLGHQLHNMAISVYECANAIKGLLEGLTDLLILIGVEAAATAAASWSVIGGVIGGATVALTITKAMGMWGQILEAQNHIWNAVQAFTGVAAGLLGEVKGLGQHRLPSGSYDHPAVAPPQPPKTQEPPVSHHRD